MHQASVGFHCPECAKGGKQQVYQGIPSLYVKPILTYVLIAVNVAVFLLQLTEPDFGNSGIDRIHLDFGLIARSVGPGGLIGVGEGQWYRLVTAGFLHFGIIHLALNMYALYILGMAMERIGGRLRMGTIYATSLLIVAKPSRLSSRCRLTSSLELLQISTSCRSSPQAKAETEPGKSSRSVASRRIVSSGSMTTSRSAPRIGTRMTGASPLRFATIIVPPSSQLMPCGCWSAADFKVSGAESRTAPAPE